MFDTLIKLLDRILELLKDRKQAESRFFSEFLEPLFTEIETAAHNYLDFFRTFHAVLCTDEWVESVATIQELRQELHLKRRELIAKVDAVNAVAFPDNSAKKEDGDKREALRSFLRAVHDFFYYEAFFDPDDREQFPSLVEILDRERASRLDHPEDTHSAVLVRLFEFLAYQETEHADSLESRQRLDELQDYVRKTIETLEAYWHYTVLSYVRLQLLMQGAGALLRKRL